ncbi:cytochrome c oxidase assembly factor 8 [Paramormyrops kingsleyae]|uniref:Cytochrome c oxidase assembly factor 8 n=1 Tax=Paramormyrops kingsleyae TaxID=1676925 RepID=A0A3B3Q3Q4_9TELE|nr:apoptogenic protein 1, mitochondrial [Paramormyrops kingsleyae]
MIVGKTGCVLWRSNGQSRWLLSLMNVSISRGYSDSQPANQEQNNRPSERSSFIPAAGSKHDWIGPPDRLSNLRPIIYHIRENETPLERRLRHLRQETEDWNHHFWANQNISFSKEKEDFIQSHLDANGLSTRDENGRKRTLSSEEMAVFYKHFLDENRVKHANYNKEWYRRNFTITFLMGRVFLVNAWKKMAGRWSRVHRA